MSKARTWISTNRALTALLTIVAVAVVLAGSLAVASATDKPAFCGSACHEMGPFHQAWQTGAHANVACVECHVDPGRVARVTHKAEAMKELWVHLTTEPTFPLPEVNTIPNERCIRCHDSIAVTATGFDHAQHASRGTCMNCHADVGHSVTDAALKSAGVFSASTRRTLLAGTVATVDGGQANVDGHVAVPCARCHDMAKTGCASCHKAQHAETGPAIKTESCESCHAVGAAFAFAHPQARSDCDSCHTRPTEHRAGACSTCHAPGPKWTFSHPSAQACSSCHDRPAAHRAGSCSTCHRKTGVSWAFTHPASANCATCHTRPAGHRSGACATCHKTAASWAFRHPGSGVTCTRCHTRPAGHRSGACATCHKTAASWAFRHPGSGVTCTGCHAQPAGHRSGACTTCHNTGAAWTFKHPNKSATCTSCHARPSGHRAGSCATCHATSATWAFRHPSSSACASCHTAPSGHYGASCASCHTPSRAWSSATFAHPSVPGGEHTYRTFACAKCHPSGYGSVNCTSCHEADDD